MHYYLNVPVGSNKSWLVRNGEEVDRAPVWRAIPEGQAAVCSVDNGEFSAALICNEKSVLIEIVDNPDDRPKRWFLVSKVDLVSVGAIAMEDFR